MKMIVQFYNTDTQKVDERELKQAVSFLFLSNHDTITCCQLTTQTGVS